jgi:hypothetical protein
LDLERILGAFEQIRKEDIEIYTQTRETEPLRDIQAKRYRSLFSQCIKGRVDIAYITSLDWKEKDRLFRALHDVAFYTMDQQVVRLMEMVTTPKLGISKVSNKQWELLYRAYLMSRQFDKVSVISKRHPLLFSDKIPVINSKK